MPVSSNQGTEASRIEEGYAVIVSPSCDRRVCVARLLRAQDRWVVDSTFAPVRPR